MGLRRLPLALLGALLLAPPAEAAVQGLARTDRPQPRQIDGLSLAGDAVVWADVTAFRPGRRQTWTVRLVRAGERPRVRFTTKTSSGDGSSVAASATHLAVEPPGRGVYRLLAGPLEGQLAPVNRSLITPSDFEWSGGLLAATEWAGPDSGPLVTVRDAAAGFSPRVLSRDQSAVSVRIAGGRIAVATDVSPSEAINKRDLRIDVLRLDDGAPEYSVTVHQTERSSFDFDLQEDGKLAWLRTGQEGDDDTATGSLYRYGIHCVMAPAAGCRGTARLEVAKREFGPGRVLTTRRFRAKLGTAAQVRFRVARSRLRALRNRAGTVWLTVSVRSTDAAGLTSVTDSIPFGARP